MTRRTRKTQTVATLEALDKVSHRKSARHFQALLNDGGLRPEEFLLALMRSEAVEMAVRVMVAEKLLPFSVPRLNAIDAEIRTTAHSHEDLIAELDADGDQQGLPN